MEKVKLRTNNIRILGCDFSPIPASPKLEKAALYYVCNQQLTSARPQAGNLLNKSKNTKW